MRNNEMTNEAYHANTARIGKSGLDLIAKSPAHYWAKYLDPNREREEPTPALIFGTAVHSAILEPNNFEKLYLALPEINRRTSEGKAEYAALMEHAKANGITFLTSDDRESCLRVRDAVHKHPAARLLLSRGVAEDTLYWEDQQTGAHCKARPDFLSTNTGFVVDVKTTQDASATGFSKSSYGYRYHVQAAWYLDGHMAALGKPAEGFAFIAVEKEPPYAVSVYYVTSEFYELGKVTYLKNLNTYVECLSTNNWPGYSDDFQPLSLPAWAK